jgi:RNA polymerase sigma factor (sigma-70 family)
METIAKLIENYLESKQGAQKKQVAQCERVLFDALNTIGQTYLHDKYLKSISIRKDEAEDTVIVTITRLMANLQVIDTQKNVVAYVRRCLNNAFVSKIRNKKYITSIDEVSQNTNEEDVENDWEEVLPAYMCHNTNPYEQKELIAVVRKLILKLSRRQREVVELRLLEQRTPCETMDLLQRTRNHVDNAYSTGLAALRKLLNEHYRSGLNKQRW